MNLNSQEKAGKSKWWGVEGLVLMVVEAGGCIFLSYILPVGRQQFYILKT
jgi:hypothetical protein